MEKFVVCCNNGKSNLFRIHVDVTLVDLKHQLSQLNGHLNSHDVSRVTGVEYLRSSVCSDGNVLFTNMKLQNDADVRTMFSIFSQLSHQMDGDRENYGNTMTLTEEVAEIRRLQAKVTTMDKKKADKEDNHEEDKINDSQPLA
ncbi:hypothetical protein QL285_037407 [Trifolium repens]|nr:hypothetical protein QL285_037407 [Trifolium repens]